MSHPTLICLAIGFVAGVIAIALGANAFGSVMVTIIVWFAAAALWDLIYRRGTR